MERYWREREGRGNHLALRQTLAVFHIVRVLYSAKPAYLYLIKQVFYAFIVFTI